MDPVISDQLEVSEEASVRTFEDHPPVLVGGGREMTIMAGRCCETKPLNKEEDEEEHGEDHRGYAVF